MGEQWRVMGHEINGYPDLGAIHQISVQQQSYYEDILKVQKSNLVLNFHQSYPYNRRTICFENFKHSMDSFARANKLLFFKIKGKQVRFTTITKLLIIQLLFGVMKLITLGVEGRIPSDPIQIVFLGNDKIHANKPKFMLKVEADDLRGLPKLGSLLRTWVNRQKGPENVLSPIENDFIEGLTQNIFRHSLCHPALWLQGTFGQEMIDSYRHFTKIITEVEIQGNAGGTLFSTGMDRKYSDWQKKVISDPILKVIFNRSKVKTTYHSDFLGLFKFHRNAFFHAYDLSAPKDIHERRAKTEMTTEMLEEKIAETFPTFFLDIYKQARGRFSFNSRAWMGLI